MLDELLEELLKEAYRRYRAQQLGGRGLDRRAARPLYPPVAGPIPWETWKPHEEETQQPAAEEETPYEGEGVSLEGEARSAPLAAASPPSASSALAPTEKPDAPVARPILPREGMKWSLIFSPPRCLDPYRPPSAYRRLGR